MITKKNFLFAIFFVTLNRLTIFNFFIMKILKFLFGFVMAFALVACMDSDALSIESEVGDGTEIKSCFITEGEAIRMANEVFSKNYTRNSALIVSDVQCILRKNQTRSYGLASDTLAYVINYEDDEGFAIMSADNRVYPLLAFNDKGNFNLANESVQVQFIDRIEGYIDQAGETNGVDYSFVSVPKCWYAKSFIKVCLGKRAPWNKYIDEDHPGCAIGCVSIAAALFLANSCDVLTYHEESFDMPSIMASLNKEWEYFDDNDYKDESAVDGTRSGAESAVEIPYEDAVDRMAKFLYWLGEDLNTDYQTNSSWAYSSDAFQLCKSLRDGAITNYLSYNTDDAVDYLHNNYILYVDARQVGASTGHAFVMDGYAYCDNMDMTEKVNMFVHCDWGWDGQDNGFYAGPVFETTYGNYRGSIYFGAKRYGYSSFDIMF